MIYCPREMKYCPRDGKIYHREGTSCITYRRKGLALGLCIRSAAGQKALFEIVVTS